MRGLVLKTFVVGLLSTNCYLLAYPGEGEAVIVDPGTSSEEELEAVLREAERLGVDIRFIVNTHGHPDHVAGNYVLKELTGAEVLIHEADAHMLTSPPWPWPGLKPVRPDGLLREGDRVSIGPVALEVLHTPGHTPGSMCLVCEAGDLVLTGDTLFAGSIGRTDLPESSHEDMMNSLVKLMRLPDHMRAYPGHGPSTTIGVERARNPFVKMAIGGR